MDYVLHLLCYRHGKDSFTAITGSGRQAAVDVATGAGLASCWLSSDIFHRYQIKFMGTYTGLRQYIVKELGFRVCKLVTFQHVWLKRFNYMSVDCHSSGANVT